MTALTDIEKRAKALADAREVLSAIVTELQAGIEALQRDHMRGLKAAVNSAAEQHDRLKTLIELNPELFNRPRTVVMHGIKCGYQKSPGRLEFDDAARVVALIRKHFPERADALIAVEESPVRSALAQLSVAELKRIGVTVTGTGDVVVIKPADSQVDKLVAALLRVAVDEKAEG